MSPSCEPIPPPPRTMNGRKALSNVVIRRFGQSGDLEGVRKGWKMSMLEGDDSPYHSALAKFSYSCGAVLGIFAGATIYGVARLIANDGSITCDAGFLPLRLQFPTFITPRTLKRVGQVLIASSTLCTGYIFYARQLLAFVMKKGVDKMLNEDLKDPAVAYKLNEKNSEEDVSCFWVAELDGEIVGAVGISPGRYGPKTAEVRRLFVHPSYQGRGIAKELMSELTEHARQFGLQEIHLNTGEFNTSAVTMYHRTGWEVEKTVTRWFLGLSGRIIYFKKSIV